MNKTTITVNFDGISGWVSIPPTPSGALRLDVAVALRSDGTAERMLVRETATSYRRADGSLVALDGPREDMAGMVLDAGECVTTALRLAPRSEWIESEWQYSSMDDEDLGLFDE